MRVINLPKEDDAIIVSDEQYFFLKERIVITENRNELESPHSIKAIMIMVDICQKMIECGTKPKQR